MDAGPIWASRTFPVRADVARKSALYNGPVADTAMALIHDVVAKAADPGFVPEPLDYTRPDVRGTTAADGPPARPQRSPGPTPPSTSLRRIRAADGTPGVHTVLCGVPVAVVRRPPRPARPPACRHDPGTVAGAPPRRRAGPHRRRRGLDRPPALPRRRATLPAHKLPATTVLAERLADVPEASTIAAGYREISYRRDGAVGVLELPLLQRRHVHRPVPPAARRPAARHRPGHPRAARCAAGNPSPTASTSASSTPHRTRPPRPGRNINAIDDVCQEIITCDRPARRVLGGGQRGRRRRHAGAGRRPGAAPRRRRAQPALPDHGPVRLGVLDLRASPAGRSPHRRPR